MSAVYLREIDALALEEPERLVQQLLRKRVVVMVARPPRLIEHAFPESVMSAGTTSACQHYRRVPIRSTFHSLECEISECSRECDKTLLLSELILLRDSDVYTEDV